MARAATAAVRLLTGEREPVRYATTAALVTTLVDGVEKIFGLQTVDGSATVAGDRVLVKNQGTQSINGIYTASAGEWYRASDARTSRTMQKGTTVHVQSGAANGGNVYTFQTDKPVVGTDAIVLTLYLTGDSAQNILDAADRAEAVINDPDFLAIVNIKADISTVAGIADEVVAAPAAAGLAQRWADEDEDVEVEPGAYSAKHWAAKSQETASEVTSVNGQTGTVVLTPANLGDGAAVSVSGRSANSSGPRADIAAAANDRILARVSNALSFVQITVGMITDGIITYAKMAAAAIATAAELRAGTASKLVDAATVHSSMAWVAITAGSAPAIDHAAGVNRTITHSANATMGAPSNAKPGMPLNIDITPGAFTTSWNAAFKFGTAGAPSITARAIVHFICRQSGEFVFLGTSDPS